MDNEFREPWRFWSKVERVGECWEWQGATTGNGYGSYLDNGKRVGAHRFSYDLANGLIPPGLQIDHLCRNRVCVNPDHLEAVTQRVNLHRGDTVAAHNATKTHCKQGHAFTEANTRIGRQGERVCRECNVLAQHRYKERHK